MTAVSNQPDRDPYVDCFKGVMILWVIHIHTVFWTGYAYIPDHVRQITLLADVPIFFFISGYLTRPVAFLPSLGKSIKTFVRLYFQYVMVSSLLLAALFIAHGLLSGWGQSDIRLAVRSMLGLVPSGSLWDFIRVYNGSLWYIRDYLSLIVLVPFLVGWGALYKIRYHLLISILVFTALFPKEYPDQALLFSSLGSVSFYLVFFMLGVLFQEQENRLSSRATATSLMLTIFLGLVVFYFDGTQLNIQKYKFPPAMQYLIYSLLLVHLFVILKGWFGLRSGIRRGKWFVLLRWCGINVFIIYLFQGAVCSLPYLFIDSLVATVHPLALYTLILSFNITLTLTVSYLYRYIQNLVSARVFRPKQAHSPV